MELAYSLAYRYQNRTRMRVRKHPCKSGRTWTHDRFKRENAPYLVGMSSADGVKKVYGPARLSE